MPKRFQFLNTFFSVILLAGLVGYFIHFQTKERLKDTPQVLGSKAGEMVSNGNLVSSQTSEDLSLGNYFHSQSERIDLDKQIWCETKEYTDLSSDPIFDKFRQWIDLYNQINCTESGICNIHDPRTIRTHLEQGESLVRAREKVMSQVLRGDPRRALELAIAPEVIKSLPPQIQLHLEKWESGFADINSIHRCFDQNHPGGWIMKYLKFPEGKSFRAWSFGKRKNLPSQRGLAVWGVSLGSDFAMSDESFRMNEFADGGGQIFFGSGDVTYETMAQKEFLLKNFQPTTRRVGGVRHVHYPIILASGMSVNKALRLKYEINVTRVSFHDALAVALERNASLLRIDDEFENQLIADLLKQAYEDGELFEGRDENNNSKTLVWIGATDDPDMNGTRIDLEDNSTKHDVDIGATEGNWRWINGEDEEMPYQNWNSGSSPSNASENFAALDWNTSDGNATWEDVNGTHARLPFIIEKNVEIPAQVTDLMGVRKVLVVPARFVDETTAYKSALGGSNNPLTNELGEEILDDLQTDSYEPITQKEIETAMAEVSEFFYRNTDERLQLVPVISSTVTLPLFRYSTLIPGSGGNPYDSDGSLTGRQEILEGDETLTADKKPETRTTLGTDPLDTPFAIDWMALEGASALSDEWNPSGYAFKGVANLSINNNFLVTNYSEPPTVDIIGGEYFLGSGPHPRFRKAKVDAIIDADGRVIDFKVVDPGAYYDESNLDINLTIDGVNIPLNPRPDGEVAIRIENLLVTYVILTNSTGSAPGEGWVGGPGAHVALSGGRVDTSIIAHEIGHNFGLFHAERYFTRSEHPLSDDYDQIEYGNPYSVMGTADISSGGDFTVPGKVALNKTMQVGGYTLGQSLNVDVAEIQQGELSSGVLNDFIEQVSDANNTFRIYRSNYGRPPAGLREANYTILVDLNDSGFNKSGPYDIEIAGTGEEANGSVEYNSSEDTWYLEITKSGRGYVEEPTIRVLDDNQSLVLNPASIVERIGTENFETAALLNLESRWLRGIKVSVSDSNVRPVSIMEQGLFGEEISHYYLSYRTDISTKGLTLNVASEKDNAIEPFLLDTTPQTPQNLEDAPLLLGKTYSDYDADLHFTPTRVGGSDLMPFIEVVINEGSVTRGDAKAPNFNLTASKTSVELAEYVNLSAMADDGNASRYAYSWYLNEQALSSDNYLNKPSIFLNFNEIGYQVVRVVVSDMKGGIASRNLIISVGDTRSINKSTISGTVRSRQDPVQGARVILTKAPVIEHQVKLEGNFFDSLFPSADGSPAKFSIDGMVAPELNFNRGEIHRFNFDPSLKFVTMSFIEGVENRPPSIGIQMLSDARVDAQKGSAYIRNPNLTYSYSTTFSNYRTQLVGTYLDMLEYLQEHNASMNGGTLIEINATNEGDPDVLDLLEYLPNAPDTFIDINASQHWNLITRPYAKALMRESSVVSAKVGPLELNEFGGYLIYGGKGYDRNNTPVVEVRRSSIWENYAQTNANASALVDGVGTISPVISTEFLGNTWESRPNDSISPSVVVWGSGGKKKEDPYAEVNASVTNWTDGASQMRTITIANQGKGFEPNSTMAVLHYPNNPFAYWSFDRHETLFEDASKARHQPSPGWNKEPDAVNLKHYWKLDRLKGIESPNEINASATFSGIENLTASNFDQWGLLGNAAEVNSTNRLFSNQVLDENFTLSMWVRPTDDFEMNFSGSSGLTYTHSALTPTYELNKNGKTLNPKIENYWTHIAIVKQETSAKLFVDGRASEPTTFTAATDLNITATDTLFLDEVRIYGVPLSDAEIRYLAGRTYLDISGNKYHATPMGSDDFLPISPETDGTVPQNTPYPNSKNGSGRLGDSYAGEENGLSLQFDGAEDYLDLSTHALEFGLDVGTFSLWVNTTSSQSPNPIFWSSSPPVIDVFTDTESNETQITITPGSFFALELSNGLPRIGGVGASKPKNRVNDGEWHHIVATFPTGQMWIDGEVVDTSPYDLQDTLYEGFDNLFSFSADSEIMNIGRAMDRTIRDQEIFFNGRIDDLIIYDRELEFSEVQFLYELRRGREQIPRLETVVDAIGTIKINNEGAGYRENPELLFWYGDEENKTDLETFPTLASLEAHFTDSNGTHGALAYVEDEDVVYSYHRGTSAIRDYSWRNGDANGWRRLVDAQGIVEFENASVGEVVWVRKLDKPTTFPLPDGRMVERIYIDYVTMNEARSTPLESNASITTPWEFYQPHGLFGFDEAVTFTVSPPTLHNEEEVASESPTAEVYTYYFLDQEMNETVTIIDGGHGITNIPSSQVRINGSGYQPSFSSQQEEEHNGFAEIESQNNKPLITGWSALGVPDVYDWSGSKDVNISTMEFNKTFSSVQVTNPGFGYTMPVELRVIGGSPQQTNEPYGLGEYNSTDPYVFEEAILEVEEIDPRTGAITKVKAISGGRGYINYQVLPEEEYPHVQYPMVTVSGGGGRGAIIRANLEANGSINLNDPVIIEDGGIGYFNWISGNQPTAKHSNFSLEPGEKNATLEVRLGGYLEKIHRCSDCEAGAPTGHDVAKTPAPFTHLEPWIEIWDRGRSETDIDSAGERAHAAPKVVNGKINKVVVTKSGRGYVDPVAYVRDVAPKATKYWVNGDDFARKWKCTFLRTTEDGRKVECGHIQKGLYPPEQCPGETDAQFPYEDENGTVLVPTGDQITGWRNRHDGAHKDCNSSESHLRVEFLARKCWGTKTSYILDDDAFYRTPRSDWLHMDAKLSVICENGKIIEIVVEDNGSNYYASQIYVEGSGTGVDAFPVFDEYGLNTSVILDDSNLKNLELDYIPRPKGAGQGFQERPWSWDETPNSAYSKTYGGSAIGSQPNDPLSLLANKPERLQVFARHSQDNLEIDSDWNFGAPVLANRLGDRIMSVEITDPGLYRSDRNLTDVTIEFNSSVAIDQNFDGSKDFVQGETIGYATSQLTRLILDNNASFEDNSSGMVLERGIFNERPSALFLDGRNLQNLVNFGYEGENQSNFIRLNNFAKYDADPQKSYIELYVDDRFPSTLYYGTSDTTQTLPAMGNRILVAEPVPGATWAHNEPVSKEHFSYTDQNGQYAFGNLDPGMYYVNVFMEDISLQESTFRPHSDPTHITKVLYVPGFPELTLETDNVGRGISSLLWTAKSRELGRPKDPYQNEFTEEFYNKKLEGIGRGFNPSEDPPELIFIPAASNLGKAKPNITVQVEVDGSLNLTIVDDENTTSYYPGDRFTIIYNSKISGIDFQESYYLSESNKTINFGSAASQESGVPIARLVIFPDDAGGINPIEVPLSTHTRGEQPFNLTGVVYDSNGSLVSTQIDWKIKLDFNSSEGNNSRVALLEDANGDREVNASGDQVKLYLFSKLREDTGSILGLEILSGGTGYQKGDKIRFSEGYGFDANITDVDVSNGNSITEIQINLHGFDISKDAEVIIWDENLTNLSAGTGASIKPVFYSGLLTVEANATTPQGKSLQSKILIRPSSRNSLTSRERWLNKYLDSFMEQNASWWDEEGGDFNDIDEDGLINSQENYYGTNPLRSDTDLDGLTDKQEVNATSFDLSLIVYRSNPLLYDTDNDGWSDWRERYNDEDGSNEDNENTTNPRSKDTDGDGLIDSEDLDPNNASGDGIISGRIYLNNIYENKPVYFRYGIWSDINQSEWQASWTGGPTSYYLTGLTDNTYTVQAFINWDDQLPVSYSHGEPFAEKNVTLSGGINQYGQNLIPVDPKPFLYFVDPPISDPDNGITVVNSKPTDIGDSVLRFLEQNITIESNATNAQNLNSFNWGIAGKDPSYGEVENNLSSDLGIWFEITDGNFTPYLESPYGNSTTSFNLSEVPVGRYFLTYGARDYFFNYAEHTITQYIEIKDSVPPYLSLIYQGGGVTTLPSSFSDANGLEEANTSAILEWNITSPLSFSSQLDDTAEVLIQLFDVKNHFEDEFHDINLPDWNVSVSFSTDHNFSTVQEILDAPTDFNVSIGHYSELFELNTTQLGTYRLKFGISDTAGNSIDFNLYVSLKAGVVADIIAVDGYLSNATVIFDADGDGVSDLDRKFYTNAFGEARVVLSKQELDRFDLNKNGRLDSNEGKFVVIGGMDTSTGTKFSGKLIADVNSSVVSPLTTIISNMMDLGATKEEAITALALALELDPNIDFTTYDPIQEAFDGDQRATTVMLANLRMANLVNQAEGLLLALSSDYQGYEVGSNLLEEIAKQMNLQIHQDGINLEEVLLDALPIALASVSSSDDLTLEDQLAMFQLMVDLDKTISEYEQGLSFTEVMDRQRVIINDLDDLFTDLANDTTTLKPRDHQLNITYQTGGTAGNSGLYPYGAKIAIFANPEKGYAFNGWVGDGILDVNAAATFITMIRDRNITAQFIPKFYEISVFSTPGGQAYGSGAYEYGQQVTLHATPEVGGSFLGWYKNGEKWSSDLTAQFDAEQEASFVARFNSAEPILELSSSAGGSVDGGGAFKLGQIVHIQALADPGFIFDGWTSEGIHYASTPSTLVVMNESRSFHATFVQHTNESKTLVLESVPVQGGSTTGSNAYNHSEIVNISAEPLPGYLFGGWIGAAVSNPSSASTTIVMDSDHALQANFLPIDYEVNLKKIGGGKVYGAGAFPYGSTVNISAVSNLGNRFVRWVGGNPENPFDQNTTLKIFGDTSLEAHFEPISYTLTIHASSGGFAQGGGVYSHGSVVEVVAYPAAGYKFSGWSGEGLNSLVSEATSLTLSGDTILQASFEPIENDFAPQAESFQFWIDRADYEPGDVLYKVDGTDGDNDEIYYSLISGNTDADGDQELLLGLSKEGVLFIQDPDEIDLSAGTSLRIIILLSDPGGKTSLSEGILQIRPKFVLKSQKVNAHWYNSDWLGYFMTTPNQWIYHYKLGWLFVSSLERNGYWLWDVSLQDWFWTDPSFFPWVFTNRSASWLYFNVEEEKVRFFDHNLQKWKPRL